MAELKNKSVTVFKINKMNKITVIVLFLVVFASSTKINAQDASNANQVYTLQQCVETAFKNNADVKQAELLAESARINYNQSKANCCLHEHR